MSVDVLIVPSTTVDVIEVDGVDVLTIETPGNVEIIESSTQGPVGPTGDPAVSLVNDEATALVVGTPVYADAAGGVKKAKADAAGTVRVVGLVQDASIAAGIAGAVLPGGLLTATTTQWDAVAGTTGGLTFNALYFLSQTTAGKLTASPAATAGLYSVPVGMALSPTQLVVRIGQPFLQ